MRGHSSHHHYETRYYESEESKQIRAQKALDEKNKKEASEELPKILGVVQKDFSTKLKGKISKVKVKIEKELSNYSPSNLKIFLQNLTENEKIKDKLMADSEKKLKKFYNNLIKIQIILIYYY